MKKLLLLLLPILFLFGCDLLMPKDPPKTASCQCNCSNGRDTESKQESDK
jgi:hypothetical protein